MMKPYVSHHQIRVAAFALLALTVATASLSAAGGTEQPLVRTAPDQILVTPEWVAEQGDAVVILDVGRSFEEFAAGHVPGAAFVQREIIATERNGVGSMLPEPDLVAADLAELEVSQGTPVVVYDAGRGTWSSRLFWALEYLGHEQVHLLDGGLTAWQETGLALSQEILVPQQGDFVAQVREQLLADQEYVESNLGNGEVLILDARSPAEYSGEDVRAARGGHVPGAINLDWVNNSSSEDPRFRPIEQLSQVYAQALQGHDGEVVTLCQAGFRAAHSYVALRILGYEEARMYDGSWSEWGNDPDAPIETDV